jgi:hypothetical protein
MAWLFEKTHKVAETSFSKFIRYASAGEKKRVYQRVLKNATERQNKLIEEVCRSNDARHAEASSPKK